VNNKKLLFILLSLWFLLLGNFSAASVIEYQQAIDAYNVGDYKTSLKLMLPLAKKGFSKAQYNLGVMYDKGKGVDKNIKKAKKWFQFAAEKGHDKAQYNLGLIYGKGKGIEKDYSKAFKWLSLAADQGNGKAQTNLGWMYEMGKGVPKDFKKAAYWYQLASDQGLAKAKEKLNLLLNHDKEKLNQATNGSKSLKSLKEKNSQEIKNFPKAIPSLGLEINKTPDEYAKEIIISNDSDIGAQQNLQLTKKTEAQVHFGLGVRFENGQGVPQDYNEAIRWYRLAAEQGHAKAKEKLDLLLNKIKEHFQGNTSSLNKLESGD
tara:strand:- start:3023 stop:3976 length:954 start_codon:yes stop_codon:yes gene_type:complete